MKSFGFMKKVATILDLFQQCNSLEMLLKNVSWLFLVFMGSASLGQTVNVMTIISKNDLTMLWQEMSGVLHFFFIKFLTSIEPNQSMLRFWLNLDFSQGICIVTNGKRIEFEKMWLQHEHCEKFVKRACNENALGCSFIDKVKHCGGALSL